MYNSNFPNLYHQDEELLKLLIFSHRVTIDLNQYNMKMLLLNNQLNRDNLLNFFIP